MPSDTDPVTLCEELLREDRQYNVEHRIQPGDVLAVDRLLARRTELAAAYVELHQQLQGQRRPLLAFLRLLLDVRAEWNPDKAIQARADRDELANTNHQIARQAAALAELLRRRSHLHNHSGFSTSTLYHVVDVIDRASEENGFYRSHLRKPLNALRTQYDTKYWPELAECLDVVARDADGAVPEPTDPLTAAATDSSHSGKADFFRAVLVAIEENKLGVSALIPGDFRPTDETLATLGNCLLDLAPDELVDGAFVKRLRQRVREKSRRRTTG